MQVVHLRCRDVAWAREFLEPTMHTLFAYVLKRNAEFGLDTTVVDAAEQYAVLRQQFTKHEIEKMFKVKFDFK